MWTASLLTSVCPHWPSYLISSEGSESIRCPWAWWQHDAYGFVFLMELKGKDEAWGEGESIMKVCISQKPDGQWAPRGSQTDWTRWIPPQRAHGLCQPSGAASVATGRGASSVLQVPQCTSIRCALTTLLKGNMRQKKISFWWWSKKWVALREKMTEKVDFRSILNGGKTRDQCTVVQIKLVIFLNQKIVFIFSHSLRCLVCQCLLYLLVMLLCLTEYISSCSYSGFPVLNAELLEPLQGSNPPSTGMASRHSSPASPNAICRRSKQVSHLVRFIKSREQVIWCCSSFLLKLNLNLLKSHLLAI